MLDQIRPQFCLLKKNDEIEVNFLQKKQVSQIQYILRFALPDADKCLGLKIGQYVQLQIDGKKRPYNPISRIDEPGQVDFLVTDLRKTNGANSFTNKLLNLQINQKIKLKGPFTQFIYEGYGKLHWAGQQQKKYKHIGIIAYEAGITGAYTLIDSIMPNYDNETGVSLLWIGEDIQNFLFLEQFSTLAQQQKLNFNLMLRSQTKGWVGPYGLITKQHIISFMPPSSPETALILVGGPQDIDHLTPILNELKYQNIMFPIQN